MYSIELRAVDRTWKLAIDRLEAKRRHVALGQVDQNNRWLSRQEPRPPVDCLIQAWAEYRGQAEKAFIAKSFETKLSIR